VALVDILNNMIDHHNIKFTLPNGALFSIVSIDGRRECAVLHDGDFVDTADWCSPHNDDDVIVRLSGGADDLMEILSRAIAWGEKQKMSEIAQALDQAL
jgi:hypothetical protein